MWHQFYFNWTKSPHFLSDLIIPGITKNINTLISFVVDFRKKEKCFAQFCAEKFVNGKYPKIILFANFFEQNIRIVREKIVQWKWFQIAKEILQSTIHCHISYSILHEINGQPVIQHKRKGKYKMYEDSKNISTNVRCFLQKRSEMVDYDLSKGPKLRAVW